MKTIDEIQEYCVQVDLNNGLTEDERIIVKRNLGFFSTADSLVANNLVLAIYRLITNPECRQYILRQSLEEAIHTHAYQYCIESLGMDEGEIFNMYREVPCVARKASWGLKYTQEFRNNLNVIEPPKIEKVPKTSKPYTKVIFKPDYSRFGLHGLSSNMLTLLKKRVYDIGAVTDHSIKKVKVGFNETLCPVKNFQQYVDLYVGGKGETKRVYESTDERWEYAIALAPNHEFTQVSFVNGICTFKGGKHVDYVMGQITRKLCDFIEKRKKIICWPIASSVSVVFSIPGDFSRNFQSCSLKISAHVPETIVLS